MSSIGSWARSAGFRTSTGFGRVLHRAPSLERRVFGRVDVTDLSWWDRIRTVPALWNIDAMDQLDVPWWTWSAIAEVQRFVDDRPDARVFEWGSGASTFWLARRCASVVSVEHHVGFAEHTAPKMARFSNVEVLVRPATPIEGDGHTAITSGKSGNDGVDFRTYVHAIDERPDERYDLIVVDGRARPDCLLEAVDRLAEDGVIVFDNSDRERYQDTFRQLSSAWNIQRHAGSGPGSPLPWESALLTRRR